MSRERLSACDELLVRVRYVYNFFTHIRRVGTIPDDQKPGCSSNDSRNFDGDDLAEFRVVAVLASESSFHKQVAISLLNIPN